jgi:hypothetical protein
MVMSILSWQLVSNLISRSVSWLPLNEFSASIRSELIRLFLVYNIPVLIVLLSCSTCDSCIHKYECSHVWCEYFDALELAYHTQFNQLWGLLRDNFMNQKNGSDSGWHERSCSIELWTPLFFYNSLLLLNFYCGSLRDKLNFCHVCPELVLNSGVIFWCDHDYFHFLILSSALQTELYSIYFDLYWNGKIYFLNSFRI